MYKMIKFFYRNIGILIDTLFCLLVRLTFVVYILICGLSLTIFWSIPIDTTVNLDIMVCVVSLNSRSH